MNNVQPIFDSATHYRIKVRGRVDVDWLQSFDSSAEIIVDKTRQMEDITVLDVETDQSGIVRLVRGVIHQFQNRSNSTGDHKANSMKEFLR